MTLQPIERTQVTPAFLLEALQEAADMGRDFKMLFREEAQSNYAC